jgi:hypothetical protein
VTEHDTHTIPAGQTPHHEPRYSRRLLNVVVAAVLFLAGTGVGMVVGSTTPQGRAVVPSPSPQRAPQSCLDALGEAELAMEYARTGFGYTSELMGISGDGFQAAARFDSDGLTDAATRMNGVTEKISALSPKMGAAVDEYNAAAALCRAAA